MCECLCHVCLSATCKPGAHRGQKRTSDPLVLESQTAVSPPPHVDVGKQTCVLWKTNKCSKPVSRLCGPKSWSFWVRLTEYTLCALFLSLDCENTEHRLHILAIFAALGQGCWINVGLGVCLCKCVVCTVDPKPSLSSHSVGSPSGRYYQMKSVHRLSSLTIKTVGPQIWDLTVTTSDSSVSHRISIPKAGELPHFPHRRPDAAEGMLTGWPPLPNTKISGHVWNAREEVNRDGNPEDRVHHGTISICWWGK